MTHFTPRPSGVNDDCPVEEIIYWKFWVAGFLGFEVNPSSMRRVSMGHGGFWVFRCDSHPSPALGNQHVPSKLLSSDRFW